MPTPKESADLLLRLYELRREPVMRQARAWFITEFNPTSFEEIGRAVSGEKSAWLRMVVNPRAFAAQLHGGGVQGFGVALGQKWIYDKRWGLHVSKRFYSNRPPTLLDVPHERQMDWVAANEPDPFNPLGARGIGEAPQGAGTGAVLCAIADALGDGYFHRTPIMSPSASAGLKTRSEQTAP